METKIPELLVTAGPLKDQRFTVTAAGIRLGRSSSCEISIPDPALSRNQCLFELRDGEIWVTDLASANGTAVNGEELGTSSRVLSVGDKVQAGDSEIVVAGEPDEAPAAPVGGLGDEGVPSEVDLGLSPQAGAEEGAAAERKPGSPLRLILWLLLVLVLGGSAAAILLYPSGSSGDGTPVAVKSAELDPSKDQLVVATNAAFEPFEYMVGEDYYGVDMEIAQYFADQLGLELVISNMEFAAVCLSVGEHKCDIAMAGLTVKEDRKAYVDFSTSYYNAAQKLIVLSTDTSFDDCKTAADVEAKLAEFDSSVKVGVQNGTTGQFYMEGDEDWGFDGFNATCVPYSNGSLAVMDMLNGNTSYVVIDSAPAKCITDAINAMR